MSIRTINTQSAISIVAIFLSTTLFILALGGCASTTPGTITSGPGPGTPDEMQLKHYDMLVSAIEAKNRVNALAALALFEGDIFRWHTNTLTDAVAITELVALTDAVDKEEWASAKKMVQDLVSKYRRIE